MKVSNELRRSLLAQRHRVGTAPAATPEEVVASLFALHATDPGSVYLAVLARAPEMTVPDVSAALYERRTLVRILAMRRTLFVVARDDAPLVYAASSAGIARMLRKRVLNQLATLPTDPPVDDPQTWLADVEAKVEAALAGLRAGSGAEISAAVPELRTALLPTTDKTWDVRRNVTSQVLSMMSAQGSIVSTEPRGSWTSRHHAWTPATAWWPDGIPLIDEATTRSDLARRWLEVFGPATVDDLQWWTSWNKSQTRTALAGLELVEVELEEGLGVALPGSLDRATEAAPPAGAALLPALDPTAMGWKHRNFYLGPHREQLFDRMGNIGPTVWWRGRIVGGWAVRPDGEVVHALLEDVGTEAERAIATEAGRLHARLDGAVIVPSFTTPLERSLRTG